jgi:hypothetical protein
LASGPCPCSSPVKNGINFPIRIEPRCELVPGVEQVSSFSRRSSWGPRDISVLPLDVGQCLSTCTPAENEGHHLLERELKHEGKKKSKDECDCWTWLFLVCISRPRRLRHCSAFACDRDAEASSLLTHIRRLRIPHLLQYQQVNRISSQLTIHLPRSGAFSC